jgi:CPA1 family monovalent cation:H+ antiporter
VGLLLVAVLVALVARRLRLPYTVGLVITGVGLALFHVNTGLTLTRSLVYDSLLPPLLFEAALSLHWQELKRDALPITLLSTLGLVVSALVVAAGLAEFARWDFRYALVFGVLIAATDPVSVIALFKEIRIVGRLRLLVEAESLFNDGVAAVLFALALDWAMAPHGVGVGTGQVGRELATTVLGGFGVGALAGGLAIALAGRTEDALVETTLTTIAAYGSFLAAEHFHASGVLATVTAGLVMGNIGVLRGDGQNVLSQRGREVVLAFWEFAAFVANSLVFLLIGLRVALIPFKALGLIGLTLTVVLTLLGRLLAVYPLCGLLARTRVRVPRPFQHVLFWGGLRGALGLALALSLPQGMPYRDEIVIASFGIVAFSSIVQGITMPWLLKRLGLLP